VHDLVNTSGTVIDHLAFDTYGNITSETSPANGDRFKFAAREYDSATGLYFNRARYYDPATGRFISQDPMSFAAGDTDLYRYVGNGPTNATDPSGLDAYSDNYGYQTRADQQRFQRQIQSGINFSYQQEQARVQQEQARAEANQQYNQNLFSGVVHVANGVLFTAGAATAAMTGMEPLAVLLGAAALNQYEMGLELAFSEHPSPQPLPLVNLLQPAEQAASGVFQSFGATEYEADNYAAFVVGTSAIVGPAAYMRFRSGSTPSTQNPTAMESPTNVAASTPEIPLVGENLSLTAVEEAASGVNVVAPNNPLKAGLEFEAQQLAELDLPKNTMTWRPTLEQTESSAFKVIVGDAKSTEGGLPKGTILDATEAGLVEIKGGSSLLGSSYQLRLQTYLSLIEAQQYTIHTSRPINPTFSDWLQRWGVTVERGK
jgi:RHS repeat-associated protein